MYLFVHVKSKILVFLILVKSGKKYWLIQIVGWSLFALLNIYIAFFEETDSHQTTIVVNILLVLCGLALTHFLRKYLLKNKWFGLETTELITRVLLANIVLALIFCVWQYILNNIFYSDMPNVSSLSQVIKPFMAAYLILLAWSLLYFTWSYIEGNRSRIITQLQLQNDMQDLELKSMRSNLQPHFIFNSLNSIRALVKEDPEASREAITKLSKILRSSISIKDDSITLDKELDLVENYLHLEKIRFEERLQYEFDIAAKTRPLLIPPMLLQNMVENAVKHGISLLEKGGTIWISSEIDNEVVRLKIKNEGHINEENKLKGTAFGMSSSKKRLAHLYPEDSSIEIKEIDHHVVVEICIPNNIKPYEN